MNMKISGVNMTPSCATKNCTTTKKQKKVKEKGSFRAAGASQLTSLASIPVSLLSMVGMQKSAKGLSPEQIATLNQVADKVLDGAGLAAKGVKIDNVTWAGLNLTGLPDSVYDMLNTYSAVANGKNAAFLDKDAKNLFTGEILHSKNTIIANREKLPTALFHEMGHAFNKNSSKIFSVMQKMRIPSMVLASLIPLFSAFTKKAEAEEGKELTFAQKSKNFVRNNSGILTAASMFPVVAEEAMASIRAGKWANANLTKDLAKRVKTGNAWGLASYVAVTAALALSATIATKVKDSIMEKQKAKTENLNNTK